MHKLLDLSFMGVAGLLAAPLSTQAGLVQIGGCKRKQNRRCGALVHLLAIGFAFSALCFASVADAAVITVDENGNGIGTIGNGFLAPDPGPGGLSSALTYNLPFNATQGEVSMSETHEGVLDRIRFNGDGTLIFYSWDVGFPVGDEFDSLADTSGPPTSAYSNFVTISEIGPEGNNGGFYTPTPGQPGFDASRPTYHFISDGSAAVPEPASIMLLGTGLLGLALFRGFRRRV